MAEPKITKIEAIVFEHQIQDMGTDYNGFNQVYEKGSVLNSQQCIVRFHTDTGVTGEYPSGPAERTKHGLSMMANYLLGKNPFGREKIYNDLKRGLRHTDRTAISIVDVALWDFAGKVYGVPIHQLLGGWRKTIPAYASTYHGDENGGLSTPEQFADFAEQCYGIGYRAFKIHGWQEATIEEQIELVHAVGRRVGDKMALMLDPFCALDTFGDALKLGLACDEENFFWYEDPLKDGGVSAHAHRKLRQMIKTPILQLEHLRGLESHVDFIVAEATDFVRGDAVYDGGITGIMKIAHAAEGFGLDVELHVAGPAQRHLMASMRNTNYYEMGLLHPKVGPFGPPVHADGYRDAIDSIDEDGCIEVQDGPGLGVEYDWEYMEKHRVDGAVYE